MLSQAHNHLSMPFEEYKIFHRILVSQQVTTQSLQFCHLMRTWLGNFHVGLGYLHRSVCRTQEYQPLLPDIFQLEFLTDKVQLLALRTSIASQILYFHQHTKRSSSWPILSTASCPARSLRSLHCLIRQCALWCLCPPRHWSNSPGCHTIQTLQPLAYLHL